MYSLQVSSHCVTVVMCCCITMVTQDLLEVNSGMMGNQLRKVVRICMKHVKQCMVSSEYMSEFLLGGGGGRGGTVFWG